MASNVASTTSHAVATLAYTKAMTHYAETMIARTHHLDPNSTALKKGVDVLSPLSVTLLLKVLLIWIFL